MIERKVNKFQQSPQHGGEDYVIASDTDSIYLNLGPLVKSVIPAGTPADKTTDILNKFCEAKIVPFIDRSHDELSEYLD